MWRYRYPVALVRGIFEAEFNVKPACPVNVSCERFLTRFLARLSFPFGATALRFLKGPAHFRLYATPASSTFFASVQKDTTREHLVKDVRLRTKAHCRLWICDFSIWRCNTSNGRRLRECCLILQYRGHEATVSQADKSFQPQMFLFFSLN